MSRRGLRSAVCGGLLALACSGAFVPPAFGAIWKTRATLGLVDIYVEMNDREDPVTVLLRVENHSLVEQLPITARFVQLTDGDQKWLRPVGAEEVVSGYLEQIRHQLPRSAREIDARLMEIKADYPQEKLVRVYGELTNYLQQDRPLTWRTQLENWLLARRASRPEEIQSAGELVERIGKLSQSYLWPTEVAPGATVTGMLFFRRPLKQPAHIYFQIGKTGQEFFGATLELAASDEPQLTPTP
jgi:hypothetical protein